jgi:hypothetical protein
MILIFCDKILTLVILYKSLSAKLFTSIAILESTCVLKTRSMLVCARLLLFPLSVVFIEEDVLLYLFRELQLKILVNVLLAMKTTNIWKNNVGSGISYFFFLQTTILKESCVNYFLT